MVIRKVKTMLRPADIDQKAIPRRTDVVAQKVSWDRVIEIAKPKPEPGRGYHRHENQENQIPMSPRQMTARAMTAQRLRSYITKNR